MEDKVYVLFSCDQWKSTDSTRLVCASANPEKAMDALENEIETGNMEFSYDGASGASAFRRFREEERADEGVNQFLEFGILSVVADGEIL